MSQGHTLLAEGFFTGPISIVSSLVPMVDFRVLVPYRTGSMPFCSTNGNTVSPLGLGHSWLLAYLGRSHLLLLMLLGLLLDKHTKTIKIMKCVEKGKSLNVPLC